MSETLVKQFTEEEINKINELRQRVLTINTRIGEIEILVHQLESEFQSLKNEKETLFQSYSELQTEESKLANELREKYGEGTYDIGTNTFTPSK